MAWFPASLLKHTSAYQFARRRRVRHEMLQMTTYHNPLEGLSKAVLLLWNIYAIFVLFLLCFRVFLFIDDLWLSAWKWLTSWFSFVMSYCEVITFPLVSCVRCGA